MNINFEVESNKEKFQNFLIRYLDNNIQRLEERAIKECKELANGVA